MQIVRRTAATIAVAAFAPLLVFGALQAGAGLQRVRAEAEAEALARARTVNAIVEAQLMADQGALEVLATSEPIDRGDWEAAKARAIEVMSFRPTWRTVILTDAASQEELWRTADDMSEPRTARGSVLRFLESDLERRVGGVGAGERDCPCVALHQPVLVDGAPRYVLTVERSPQDIQDIMMSAIEGREVAAVVDRDGLFIARSLDYSERLATPATEYVRQAVAAGGEGLYIGVTYEGLQNRTAYTTSALSGWSTHIAVPSIGFMLLDAGSLGFTLLAGGVALAFAAVVAWFGVQDLRVRRLSERAQLQSQKLEAIGQIAGGVAHDFNNLLAVMIACLKQLQRSATAPKDVEVIEQGLATAERGAELTRSLLSFARTKPLEVACVDLRMTIAGIRDLLARSLGSGVTLEIALADDARFARTNAAQLELALLNLAVNARDAMPNGGTLTISSRPSRVRGHVDLVVRDTGFGMAEDVAARALEPFYTTKPEGKGTGLGLVQVHSLVTQSGGALELNTAPGKGAEFVLRLTACQPGK